MKKIVRHLLVISLLIIVGQIWSIGFSQVAEIQAATSIESITDYSDFVCVEDTQYIESENYISSVNFSYHGNEAPASTLEMYKLVIDDEKNVTDFWLEAKVDYHYILDQDTGGFGYCIGPNREEPIDVVVDSHSVLLTDESDDDYVMYEIWALAFDKKQSLTTDASGGMELEGTVIFYMERVDGNLTLMIKELGTEKMLLGNSWTAGVDNPVNVIALAFEVGLTSNFNISTYDISGEFTIEESTYSNPFSFLLKMNFIAYIVPLMCLVIGYTITRGQRKK